MSDRVTTYATCWELTLTDTTVFRFTDHDADMTVGGELFVSAVGYVESAHQSNTELSPDNLDVSGIISDDGIKESDLKAGRFDYATIRLFFVDWSNPAGGEVGVGLKGKLGAVSLKQGQFTVELNSLAYQLNQNIGEVYSTLCPADLGDARCKINMAPDEWQLSTQYSIGDEVTPSVYNGRVFYCSTAGTSDSVEPSWNTTLDSTTTDNTVAWTAKEARTKNVTVTGLGGDNLTFADSDRTEADDYFNGGLCTWTTGDNAGYSMDIKDYALTGGVVVLYESMPFDIQIGDTGTLTRGCDKTIDTCKDVFSNIENFRGHPHIPGKQKLLG